MNNTDPTIRKNLLLNWLYMTKQEVSLVELGCWIEAKTEGEYSLVKKPTLRPESSDSYLLNRGCA
jgi:hypothetical protein